MKIFALVLLLTLGKIGTVQCQMNKNNLDSIVSVNASTTKATDADKSDKVFTKVEREASFPGGAKGWLKYLQENLDANAPNKDKAPPGNYTVKVGFIVDNEGNVKDVHAIETPKGCPSCAKAAVRVIKQGPQWTPAMQNGKNVIYMAEQAITFAVAAN